MFAASALDKASPIPLYVQLASRLESLIAEGAYPVGERLPGEEDLARQYTLNRNTVRHALALLAQSGLVRTERGVGTFVERSRLLTPIHRLDRITSFVDDFNLADVRVQDVLLERRKTPATADLARKLGVAPGAGLVRIDRLRSADGVPYVFERQYYDHARFGRLLEIDIQGSLYQLLVGEFAADLHHSVQTLSAVLPTREIAVHLGISTETPCMFLESLTSDAADRCLEVLQACYRGDRYTFRVESGQYAATPRRKP
jgi:DNA-binding GntR family transcriptional regulator